MDRPDAAPRWIRRLSLSWFRSHRATCASFDARPVVLTGPNGIGKTNLLEALSLLAPGRGLRGAALADLRAQAAPADAVWGIAADVGGAEVSLGVGGQPDAPERRLVRIAGAPSTPAHLADHLDLLWLTPEQDRLFTDTAGARRRFFDRLVLVLYPDHGGHVSRYEAALRARNRLLEPGGPPADTAWLDALEAQAAAHGVAIAAARVHALAELDALITALPETPFPKAALAWTGDVEAQIDRAPALAIEDALRASLKERRARDAAAGRATHGPHRSDLTVLHRPKAQAAALCSTGEQKSLLIGLVLAQARLVARLHGRRPLLLLDEVAAHLDGLRRGALFDLLGDLAVQAWMTGTDAALFEAWGPRAQYWTIAGDGLRQEHEPTLSSGRPARES